MKRFVFYLVLVPIIAPLVTSVVQVLMYGYGINEFKPVLQLPGYFLWSAYLNWLVPRHRDSGPASPVRQMAASWDDCGGGLRFHISDRCCALRPASEGLAMGEAIAGSHRRGCRTRLLLVTRSTEQRTLKQIWLDDPQHDQSSQAMARIELKNEDFRCWPLAVLGPRRHDVRFLRWSGRHQTARVPDFMMGWTPRRRHRCAKVEVFSTT